VCVCACACACAYACACVSFQIVFYCRFREGHVTNINES